MLVTLEHWSLGFYLIECLRDLSQSSEVKHNFLRTYFSYLSIPFLANITFAKESEKKGGLPTLDSPDNYEQLSLLHF